MFSHVFYLKKNINHKLAILDVIAMKVTLEHNFQVIVMYSKKSSANIKTTKFDYPSNPPPKNDSKDPGKLFKKVYTMFWVKSIKKM